MPIHSVSLPLKTRQGSHLLIVLLLFPLAILSGLMAVVLPIPILIPVLLVPFFAIAAWWRPEYAIAFLVLVVSGFLPDSLLPSFPLIGGTMHAQDIFLGFICIVTIFKHGSQSRRWLPGLSSMMWPLVALMGLALLSAVYSRLAQGTQVAGIIEELRPYVFWSLPLWIAMAIDSQAAFRRFVVAIMILAVVLAFSQVIQATTGFPLIHGGRLETANIGKQEFSDVIRSTVPGIYLIFMTLLLVISRYLLGKQGILLTLLLSALLASSILFTFGRTLWITATFGLLFVGFSLGFGRMVRVGFFVGSVVIVAIGIIAIAKPHTAEVMVDRALSVSEEGGSNTSLGWRFEENRLAWIKIKQSPLFGIGLGAVYKPMGYQRGWEGEQRITHNSHVFVLLKLGLVGYGILFWIWCVYWRENTRLIGQQQMDPRERALFVALRSLLPMVLISSFTRPEWMEPATVCVFALGLGLIAAFNNLAAPVAVPKVVQL